MGDDESTQNGDGLAGVKTEAIDVGEWGIDEHSGAKTKAIDIASMFQGDSDEADAAIAEPVTQAIDISEGYAEPEDGEKAVTRAIDVTGRFEARLDGSPRGEHCRVDTGDDGDGSQPGIRPRKTEPLEPIIPRGPVDGGAIQRHRTSHGAQPPDGDTDGDSGVRPFKWDQLPRISQAQCRGIDQLYAALPAGERIEGLTERLSRRMTELLGIDHTVELSGVGTVMASGRNFDVGDGVWAWGKMPPNHGRIVAGMGLSLAVTWLGLAAPGHNVIGDDFEFGIASFLIAQFCAQLTDWAGWPCFSWAVNPMNRRDLKAMMLAEESPLLEVTFAVRTDTGAGPVRLWLPASVVRHLQQSTPVSGEDTARDQSQWWGRFRAAGELIAGRTTLTDDEFNGLQCGDIVIVDQHGVATESLAASARCGATRWLVSRQRMVTGQLVDDGDGRWQLKVEGAQIRTCRQGEDVTDTQPQKDSAADGSAAVDAGVDTAGVQLEVRVGVVEMELGELTTLKKGQVLDCDRPLGSPVDLVVQGAKVGRGELVNVDGRLGVRLLEMMDS